MKTAVLVAVIAAVPPTVAALLVYLQTRAANREAHRDDIAGLRGSVDELRGAVSRVESTVGRIDNGVVDIRERVARLEGAHAQDLGSPR